jgi:hypothetical protein
VQKYVPKASTLQKQERHKVQGAAKEAEKRVQPVRDQPKEDSN